MAQIAYVFSPAFWGWGYATEACKVIDDYGVHAVTAEEVDTRNAPSIRLLERLGFKRVAYRPGADFFKGAVSDEYTYRLHSNSDWPRFACARSASVLIFRRRFFSTSFDRGENLFFCRSENADQILFIR